MSKQYAIVGQGGLPAFVSDGSTKSFGIQGEFVNTSSGRTDYILTASVGSFTITGVAAGINAARNFTASTGTFTITGNAATLTWSGAPVSSGGGRRGGMGMGFGGMGRLGATHSPFGSSAPSAFTLTDVISRVYQRSASLTSGPLTLSGTFSGGRPSTVQAQCLLSSDDSVVVDWTTLAATSIGSSTWTGTLHGIPTGGPYYVKVRPVNAASLVNTGGTSFYMGDWFICYGQSFMNGIFGDSNSPPAASAGTGYYDGITFTTPPNANGVREMLNGYLAKTGIPCAAINGAVNGTAIGNLVTGNTNFDNLATKLSAIGNDAAYIVWFQGSGDANALTPSATYVNQVKTGLHDPLCQLTGRTTSQLPFVLCGLMKETGGAPYTDDGWYLIQTALRACADILPDVYYSHADQDIPLADSIHATAIGSGTHGKRFAQTLAYINGSVPSPASWFATSAALVDATHSTINLTHGLGTDFTPTSGITGFEVSEDDGATWVTCTGVRASATSITLTHVSIGNTRIFRYLYGMNPDTSGMVLDNSSLTLPLAPTGTNYLLAYVSGATPTITINGYAGGSASSHNVSIPSGVFKGNLLVIECASYDQSITTPSGWTALDTTTTSGGLKTGTFYKYANGTEGGSVSISLGGAGRLSSRSLRFVGQKSLGAIEIAAPVSTNSSAPNPGAVTPSWGSANNVWIVGLMARSGGSATLISAYPAGYTDNQAESTNSNSLGASAAIATKAAALSSDDPAAWTLAGAREVVATTIVVSPT